MARRVPLLRTSYWVAAIADFVIAGLALMPKVMGTAQINYPMGLTSVMAFSWGVMLLVADRKPVERRWMLIPTILAVLLVTATRVVFALRGVLPFSIGLLLLGIGVAVLMVVSLLSVRPVGSGEE